MFNLLILATALSSTPTQTPTAVAVPEALTQVKAVRVEGSISVDGKLDEPAWQQASPYSTFTQRDPNEGQRVSEETEVRVMYDDDSIYIGARLVDSQPKAIKALLGRRDSDLASDSFTVYLDPYNDKRTGFYFGISAGGTLSDGTLFNDDWDDNAWDGIWEARRSPTARDGRRSSGFLSPSSGSSRRTWRAGESTSSVRSRERTSRPTLRCVRRRRAASCRASCPWSE